MPSAYELVLGSGIDELHPRLRAYFGVIPPGGSGRGVGVFDQVGTPRRWLWPVLWVLARQAVLFPAWQRQVPFTVTNRSAVVSPGNVAVLAERVFHFAAGDFRMLDAVTAENGGLVDYLGMKRRYRCCLAIEVVDGELRMTSTSVSVRIWRAGIRLPRLISPVVTLTERFDDASERQQVSVTVESPLLGRLYEYSGSFRYEILAGETEQ
jgi:hypothetical protein